MAVRLGDVSLRAGRARTGTLAGRRTLGRARRGAAAGRGAPRAALGFDLGQGDSGSSPRRAGREAQAALRGTAALVSLRAAAADEDVVAAATVAKAAQAGAADRTYAALGAMKRPACCARAALAAAQHEDGVLGAPAAALAHDLALLQRLDASLAPETLVDWATSLTDARDGVDTGAWADALLASLAAGAGSQSLNGEDDGFDALVTEVVDAELVRQADADDRDTVIEQAPSAAEVSAWARWLRALPDWGCDAGVAALRAYKRRYGAAPVAGARVLEWRDGALKAATLWDTPDPALGATAEAVAALEENALRHARGLPAQHALLVGPRACGKSVAAARALAAAQGASGLRIVVLRRAEIKTADTLAAELAKHPRARFAVLADDLALLPMELAHAALERFLDEAPKNAVLVATSLSPDCLRATATADERAAAGVGLGGRIGLRLEVTGSDTRVSYLDAVAELVPGSDGDKEAKARAAAAADARGSYSLRAAAQFACDEKALQGKE